ncbi:hypothetical protein KIH75_08375 [Bifidobacterium sp. 64T4]|nr:DUF5361 domain-containing protein [Bifidobacterium pongonis]MBW3095341.1 hypothetical protein [Bifidobacterium pongonis]
MLDRAPDKLRADLQRYYGLDLDELGLSIRCRRMADLAANLPQEARIWQAIDPRAEWTDREYLLATIADNTGFLAWSQTKEAQHANAKWHGRIPRPGEHAATPDVVAVDVDELGKILSRPRG